MISRNLASIRSQLPSAVQLVAVSKFHPVERLMEAYDAGQRIFAESRPQELAAKVPLMPSDVQWHFIGHLQTNKLKLVLPFVSLVQSVDSFHLLEAISRWAEARGRQVDVLLELHLGTEQSKQGFSEEEILSLLALSDDGDARQDGKAAEPFRAPFVRIRGLMAMATNTEDETQIDAEFARVGSLFRRIQARGLPAFDQLSIGMSGDWPLALRHGATMVRIGTDIFGPREY